MSPTARCGCSSACNCVVQGDGTTTEVTGNGSPGSPYVVKALPQGVLTVLDTDSVDLTLTGTGAQDDPYEVSGEVIYSTDPNNCAAPGLDGGVFVPCPDGSETIVQGDGVTTSVEGNGTTGTPYIVHAIPADQAPIEVDATPCIDLSGTGVPGDPITATPIIAPEPNGLECGPTGLTVPPSSDVGNTLTIGTDGRLLVPPAAAGVTVADTDSVDLTITGSQITADVKVDCGLEITPTGVRANVQTWPFACDIGANGGGVYCDPATGELRSEPRRFTAQGFTAAGATQVIPGAATPCPGPTLLSQNNAALVINNPDPCRPMIVEIEIGGRIRPSVANAQAHDINATTPPEGFNIDGITDVNFNGGAFQNAINENMRQTSSVAGGGSTVAGQTTNFLVPTQVIPPGGALTIGTRQQLFCVTAQLTDTFVNTPSVHATGWSQ